MILVEVRYTDKQQAYTILFFGIEANIPSTHCPRRRKNGKPNIKPASIPAFIGHSSTTKRA